MPRRKAAPPAEDQSAESAPHLAFDPAEFSARLAHWFKHNARDLPWRNIRDPYATWLSEIMLQQTRVATVIERYVEFLERFPTVTALAEAEEADVLALWSGLGYYRRARMLHRGAQFVLREFDGKLPRTSHELRTLPGVGDYTAAAIASIAFRERIAAIDGNVERVINRVLGWPEDRSTKARAALQQVAQSLVPPLLSPRSKANPPGDHNQAMMELGATVCTPRSPLCLQCPVVEFCQTRGEHITAPRAKQKSRTVAYLLAIRKRGTSTEVLLHKRDAQQSLMANMLELPPLPMEAVAEREPTLRLRHSITDTSYYVQIFTESAPGVPPHHDPDVIDEYHDELVVATPDDHVDSSELLPQIAASAEALQWHNTKLLALLPLTGLARKALQRSGVMLVPRPTLAGLPPLE
ncbi:A/G-specific adenine glycosylase [Granulicella cerasi]|uniref:A/G-specific adenine glycosylase n=1 Tax=Granulicella cerasi TaxID=741063 RepID=A0ABW1ZDE7_9BACT|nr:A/G-specific adenine glycosylase [Granulicella cerasi]